MDIQKLDLETAQKIIITTHQKPDADALGSSLGLANYLLKKGHQVQVITPTDYPRFLFWMKGHEQVLVFTDNQQGAEKLVAEADVIYCLDFSSLSRINELGELVRKSNATKVLIDHHQNPEDFSDYELWDVNASSTCELIYRYIALNEELHLIDGDIANCIYAGMMTDTGSFRFPSTGKAVHLAIADLMDRGLDHAKVHQAIYDDNNESRLRLLGYCLSEKLVVLPDLHTAYFALSKKELQKFNFQTGDTEGVVNYALSMRGIVFAAIFIETTDIVKASFRSVGSFSASSFSKENFNGGGHHNAAGGRSDESLENTVERFLCLVEQQKENLTETYKESLA